jgi:peptide/nickel transport system permease protein
MSTPPIMADESALISPPPNLDTYRRRRKLTRLPRSLSLRVGLVIVGVFVLLAIVSAIWTPFDPQAPSEGLPYLPPGGKFLLGTDQLGEDVLSRVMAGTQLDLGIAVAAVAVALVIGTFLGILAGYFGGWIDTVILRITEMIQAFPALLLAMLTVEAVGAGVKNIILVMAFVGFPDYLRLVRAEVLTRRTWQFTEAARMVGGHSWRIAFRHLLPNSIGPLLAFTSVNAAWVVLNTASLGFLGLGLTPGTPEWGSMVAAGSDGITTGSWWPTFFPGLAIVILAAAFYFIGDAISDLNDPRRRT